MTMNERDEGRRLKDDDTLTNKDHENYDDGGDERPNGERLREGAKNQEQEEERQRMRMLQRRGEQTKTTNEDYETMTMTDDDDDE